MSYLLTYEEAAEIVLSGEKWTSCQECMYGFLEGDDIRPIGICAVCNGAGKTLSKVYQEAFNIVEACNEERRSR